MLKRKDHLDGIAVGLLLACCVFWGFQQVLVKATIPHVPPVVQAFLRFAGATVLLLIWCRVRGIALFARDATLGAGLVAGLLFAGEFAALFIGLKYTSASRLTVFVYTSPLWVAVLLPLFVKAERLRPMQWLGITCAFVAVLFALREGFVAGARAGDVWLGDTLAVLAGMLWGLTTVVIRSTSLAKVSAEKLLFYQVAVSALLLPFVSLALGERWTFDYNALVWGSLVVQTVVGAFLSYLTWMWLLGRYPATKISVFVFLTPVFALIFGSLWLNEHITPTLVIALGLVAVGIVLVNKKA